MKRTAAKRYASALRAIEGYGTYGPTIKATLNIGRRAGLTYGGWREGDAISRGAIAAAVTTRRIDQLKQGESQVGYNIVVSDGKYKGKPERSVKVDLIYDGSDGSPKRFYANVKRLAQEVAADLGQREIIIEWQAPGRKRTDTASPSKAPSPTRHKKFCAWVRRFSASARGNRRDDCHEDNE